MSLPFNPEEYAPSIEQGLYMAHPKELNISPRYWLRMSVCGLASVVMQKICDNHGVTTRLRQVGLNGTPEGVDSHVYVQVDNDERMIIDPTYSQFMCLVGLNPFVDQQLAHSAYPVAKIAVFDQNKCSEHAAGLADTMMSSRRNFPLEVKSGNFCAQPRHEMRRQLARIWDPLLAHEYQPSPGVRNAAELILREI